MKSSNKPQRITQSDLASATAAGVKRALQARECSVRELSQQEVADVSGGALSLKLSAAIIAGGLLRDILANGGMTAPTLPDAGSFGGMTGMV